MAIVGLGRMGMFHVDLIARHLPAIDVVAVADSRPEAIGSAVSYFGAARRYDDALDCLESDGLDACLVTTPTVSHQPLVEAGIAAGLHVLCEKPITLQPDKVLDLTARAGDAGVTLQTGFWRRFSPAWVAAREAVRSGAVGSPLLVRSSQWDASAPPLAFCDRNVSGGLFVDCGVHDFDIIEWVTGGNVTSVTAVPLALADVQLASVGDVDNALLLLGLEKETVGVIDISRNGGYVDEVRMEILGTEGSILLTTEPHGQAILRTRSGVETLTAPSSMSAFEHGVVGELAAFADRVRGGDTPVPGGPEDARALDLAQVAWLSHDSGGAKIEVGGSGVRAVDPDEPTSNGGG